MKFNRGSYNRIMDRVAELTSDQHFDLVYEMVSELTSDKYTTDSDRVTGMVEAIKFVIDIKLND